MTRYTNVSHTGFYNLFGSLCRCVKLKDLKAREGLDLIEEDEEVEEEMQTIVIEEPSEKWDCESILSKYIKNASYCSVRHCHSHVTLLYRNWLPILVVTDGH